MKYWRINSLYNFNAHVWTKSRILDEITMYLWQREYLSPDFDKNQIVKSPDNRKYKLNKVWNAEGNIFSVFILNESNWECTYGLSEPQIVMLIKDYFKANNSDWYYLETLDEMEDSKISKTNRVIEPLTIKKLLDSWPKEQIPMKPEIVEIGKYEYQQTDIYYGLKSQFKSVSDFWISCVYWVSAGEFEAKDLSYYANQSAYDLTCGSCIPMNLKEVEEIVAELQTKVSGLITPVMTYLMRKNWNDKMFVLEYEDRFLMHHWHTAE